VREVWIRGAAMTRFGNHEDRSARDLVEEALRVALEDAEVGPHDVQAAYTANALGGLMSGQESIRGQVVLRRTGLMGVPMINVENASTSSLTALHLGWQAVASGIHDCVVVVGYEKVDRGDLARSYRAVNSFMDMTDLRDIFGAEAGADRNVFMDMNGAISRGEGGQRFDREALALVSVKNHYHGSMNSFAQYQAQVTEEQVLDSREMPGPLTRLMCASLCDGAACLVLCAPDFRRGRTGGAKILASVLLSGRGDDLRQPRVTGRTVAEAFETAGVGPEDLDVAELYDPTAILELYQYEEAGLCPEGDAGRLIKDRVTWLGGRLPVNTSGGAIARGHAVGATGAAQVVELAWQLQGRCGARQVPHPRLALAQNQGGWVGSDFAACAVVILQV
jgi:acetyl-CoA acetyltransferase